MPLEFSTPPADAAQILQDAVGTMVSAPLFIGKLAGVGADASQNQPDAGAPQPDAGSTQNQYSLAHEIYFMRLDDLASGAGLDKAQLKGWRYLKTDAPDSKTSVEVYTQRTGEQEKGFAQITSGPYCQSTLRAIKAASQNSDVQNGSYEPRLLHVPALALMALWSHKKKTPSFKNDIFFPLAPIPSFLVADKVYSAAELLEKLHEVAPSRMPKTTGKPSPAPQER